MIKTTTLLSRIGLTALICLTISCTTTEYIDRPIKVPASVLTLPEAPVPPAAPRTNGDMHLYRKRLETYTRELHAVIADIIQYLEPGEQAER